MIANALRFKEIAQRVAASIGNAVLTGYGVAQRGFPLLEREFEEAGIEVDFISVEISCAVPKYVQSAEHTGRCRCSSDTAEWMPTPQPPARVSYTISPRGLVNEGFPHQAGAFDL